MGNAKEGVCRFPRMNKPCCLTAHIRTNGCFVALRHDSLYTLKTRGIPMKRAVLYLRVSTRDQTTTNQERELRVIAGRMGCKPAMSWSDVDYD
jgi:hypothetical protein